MMPASRFVLLGALAIQALADEGEADWLESGVQEYGQTLDVDGEGLLDSDFQVTRWSARYGHQYDAAQWDVSLGYETYNVDLRSPDPFFVPFSARADRALGQARFAGDLGERWTWQGLFGAYQGMQNYRSLWLRGYYRQLGAFFEEFGNQPYPDIDPSGRQAGALLRYEYLPGSAYVEGGLSHSRDLIVPSAEFDLETLIGPGALESFAWHLSTENILTPRLRSLVEFRITDTSVRELRYSLQGSLNAALAEKWVLRSQAGWVTERPHFDAWFLGGSLERDLGESWQTGFSLRYYQDTGEIQDSLPANNAPPGLESWQMGVFLRWTSGSGGLKLGAGPYFTRYQTPENTDAPFFEDLYRSRDWATFQVAWSTSF